MIDYHKGREWSLKLLLEKVPLFIFAGLAVWIAGQGQESSDSMVSGENAPIWQTIFIGSRNYLIYLLKFVVPWDLSPFHPFPFAEEVKLSWIYYLTPIPILGLFALGIKKRWWQNYRI